VVKDDSVEVSLRPGTAAVNEMLLQAAHQPSPGRVSFAALEGLPPPVVRYFKRFLRDGQRFILVGHLEQEGRLRTGTRSNRWLSFEARQVIVPSAPGFVWDARVSLLPLLHLRVRDAYVGGTGSGRVSLLSAITLAADSGGEQLNSGALHRYLAEAVWYPTALLPGASLEWRPIDGSRALATLTDSGTSVSLEFRFDGEGEVTGIYSPGRWGKFGKEYRQAPWEGHFRHYREQDGMLVPSEADVGWYREDEWQPVWEGKIRRVSYQFAP
jgi:hypothetical protein